MRNGGYEEGIKFATSSLFPSHDSIYLLSKCSQDPDSVKPASSSIPPKNNLFGGEQHDAFGPQFVEWEGGVAYQRTEPGKFGLRLPAVDGGHGDGVALLERQVFDGVQGVR